MKKKSLISLAVVILCMFTLVGSLVVTNVLAKDVDHQHEYKTFVSNIVENGKAYEVRKCSCNEIHKEEMVNAVAATTETAQNILDNIEDGKTIVLDEGNYGNLYLRKNDTSIFVENNWAGSGEDTFKRSIKNVTILGTENTVVNSIIGESSMYSPNGNTHSLADEIPYLNMYLDIENLTIKNIKFTPTGNQVAVRLAASGYKTSINGLTVENCIVDGSGTINEGTRLFLSDDQTETVYTYNGQTVMTALRRNITIKNCILNNLHQGIKINHVENLTISGNMFNNIKGRDMLIGGGSGEISGDVKISKNISHGSTERFIRMNGLTGILTIENNTVVNNNGADFDIVKIVSKPEAEINFFSNNWEGLTDKEAKDAGVILY